MRLAFICKDCEEESQLNFVVGDRFQLLAKHGKNYSCHCAKCGALNEIHVNRIYARNNRPLLIISLIFAFSLMAYLANHYYLNYVSGRSLNIGLKGVGIVFTALFIPLFAWGVIYSSELEKIRRFNDHRA